MGNGILPSASRRKIFISYGIDWSVAICFAIGFAFLGNLKGCQRVFSVQDTSLRHPYSTTDLIPNLYLGLICLLGPLVLQIGVNYATVRSWRDFHHSTLGLVLSLSITGVITQYLRLLVGRPRPDFLARCNPAEGATDPTFGLSSVNICSKTDPSILIDGFRSFPSEHASLSFAGMGFFSLYIAGKLRVFDQKGHVWKVFTVFGPLSFAALVAIYRTIIYRNHWEDVVAGSLLGVSLSFLAYRQYFPSLQSEDCWMPLPSRYRAGEESALPIRFTQLLWSLLDVIHCCNRTVRSEKPMAPSSNPPPEDFVNYINSSSESSESGEALSRGSSGRVPISGEPSNWIVGCETSPAPTIPCAPEFQLNIPLPPAYLARNFSTVART